MTVRFSAERPSLSSQSRSSSGKCDPVPHGDRVKGGTLGLPQAAQGLEAGPGEILDCQK